MQPFLAFAMGGLAVAATLAGVAWTDRATDRPALQPTAGAAVAAPRDGPETVAPREPLTPPGCGRAFPPGMRPGESFEQTIAIDGVARHYRLNIPSAASPGQRLPVVLNFHGRGSDAATQLGYSGFSRVSERQQFLLVTPDGSGAPRAWSAGATPPGDVDDVRFVASLLERLDAELCVDRDRVYAVGFSNGGFFAALLGCKLSDRITAVAAVGGAQRPTAGCGGAVPFLAIHGTADSIVPFGGGTIRGRYPYPGARATNADWAIANGCGGTPVLERVSAHVVRETVRGCVAPVLLYVVDGGGHTWPGASDIPGLGPTTLELNAAEVIWAFFSGAKSAR